MASIFGSDKWVEYHCSHCNALSRRHEGTGKPFAGSCPRRNKLANGQPRPHV